MLQNLFTLASSRERPPHPIQMGAGLVKNCEKKRAVKACSPPDKRERICNFFPGGLAIISKLILMRYLTLSFLGEALPPPKSFTNNCWKFLSTSRYETRFSVFLLI